MKQAVRDWKPKADMETFGLDAQTLICEEGKYRNWASVNRPVANHDRGFANWLARVPKVNRISFAAEGQSYVPQNESVGGKIVDPKEVLRVEIERRIAHLKYTIANPLECGSYTNAHDVLARYEQELSALAKAEPEQAGQLKLGK